jgi:hypothetical protein
MKGPVSQYQANRQCNGARLADDQGHARYKGSSDNHLMIDNRQG